MTETLQEQCDKILEILSTRGWIQYRFSSPDGVCLSKAIWLAQGGDKEFAGYSRYGSAIYQEILRRINTSASFPEGQRYFGVSGWNDEPGRTFEDVVRLLSGA